jgi:hypothetical protein
MEARYGLSGQHAIVLASVRGHLEGNGPEESCFLSRNSKDFDDPDIRERLEALTANSFRNSHRSCRILRHGLGDVRPRCRALSLPTDWSHKLARNLQSDHSLNSLGRMRVWLMRFGFGRAVALEPMRRRKNTAQNFGVGVLILGEIAVMGGAEARTHHRHSTLRMARTIVNAR